jgi:hypothetical protein
MVTRLTVPDAVYAPLITPFGRARSLSVVIEANTYMKEEPQRILHVAALDKNMEGVKANWLMLPADNLPLLIELLRKVELGPLGRMALDAENNLLLP